MKTALITGANKSIGFETAKVLLKNGYYVYLGSRDLQRGQQAVDMLKAEGLTSVEVLQIDVADERSVQQAKSNLSQKTPSLDLLINNAGILGSYDQKASDVSLATVREVYETNFFGVIQVTQAFLPLVQKSSRGVIVNVTSGLGSLTLHSDPNWKHYHVKTAAYGTSKTALNAYSVVLAYELRDTPVKVNVVDPGYTATDFNNNQGPLKVEDSAAFVAKYAMIGADGPTGKFFSHDYDENNNESPW